MEIDPIEVYLKQVEGRTLRWSGQACPSQQEADRDYLSRTIRGNIAGIPPVSLHKCRGASGDCLGLILDEERGPSCLAVTNPNEFMSNLRKAAESGQLHRVLPTGPDQEDPDLLQIQGCAKGIINPGETLYIDSNT